jgi:hypothetical protein
LQLCSNSASPPHLQTANALGAEHEHAPSNHLLLLLLLHRTTVHQTDMQQQPITARTNRLCCGHCTEAARFVYNTCSPTAAPAVLVCAWCRK